MIKAFMQLFSAITMFGSVFENVASMLFNITKVGDEMSGAYLDQSRADRAKQRLTLDADVEATRLLTSVK